MLVISYSIHLIQINRLLLMTTQTLLGINLHLITRQFHHTWLGSGNKNKQSEKMDQAQFTHSLHLQVQAVNKHNNLLRAFLEQANIRIRKRQIRKSHNKKLWSKTSKHHLNRSVSQTNRNWKHHQFQTVLHKVFLMAHILIYLETFKQSILRKIH